VDQPVLNNLAMSIPTDSPLKNVLACPACYADLIVPREGQLLTCASCSRQYEIVSGIPILCLKDSAWDSKKKQIEAHIKWDQKFPTVDEHLAYRKKAISEIRNLVSLHLGRGNGGLVLDVGGNTGHASNVFIKAGYRAINMDFVYQYLEMSYEINRRYYEEGKYLAILGDIVTLPFKTNVFDVVLCRDTLHHCVAPEVLIKELFRVCKDGGLVVLIDPREPLFNFSDLIAKFYNYRDRKDHDLITVIHPNTNVDGPFIKSTLGSYGLIFLNKSVLIPDIFTSKLFFRNSLKAKLRFTQIYTSACRIIPSFLQGYLAILLPSKNIVIAQKKTTVNFEKTVLDYPPVTFKDLYVGESMTRLKRAMRLLYNKV
jgi:SAM-dependent methyltransferase